MVVRAIGRGSYGEIWLARSLTGAWRAVKIVERMRFEDSRAFDREFEGMAQFEPISREHQGFVDILHVGRADDHAFFYYVMELADDLVPRDSFDPWSYQSKTLKSELQRSSRLPADEVVTLGLSLTTALATLHRHGLVHRDIKPANIIFCGGLPKIADIGLVSALGQNSFVGTEGYVPPEGPGTVQADLYSLGKVLYEIAMGKDRLDFPALNTRIGELPDRELLMRLNEVLLRACHFRTDERYATAEEMHEDLERVRDGRPLLGGPAHQRRKIWPVAALLALGVGAAVWWGRTPPAEAGGLGSAYLESDPPGVQFMVETFDRRMITTPYRLTDLPVGEHLVRPLSPLYDRDDFKFTVAANGEAKPPKFTLRRSTGVLNLGSKPGGCDFRLMSGTEVVRTGKTPMLYTDIPTGEYEVVMLHEGHEKRLAVKVEKGDPEHAVKYGLEFGSREFSVTSNRPGVEIFADGKSMGKTPQKFSLVEGEHELVAKYGKWPNQTRRLTNQSETAIDFTFESGSVKIISKPSGAEIFIGDKKLGETPHLEDDLEAGEITYTLKLPGFEPAAVTATVQPGKQVSASWRFESPAVPRRGEPWENSLGMKFRPVGDVLVGVWPVRRSDFAKFCEEEGRARAVVDFPQEDNHPAVLINWDDATAFCEWLTKHELAANKLDDGQVYRLPTDAEWSAAAGMAPEGGATPEQRDGLVKDLPWGKAWPPPPGVGNFADAALKKGSYGSRRVAIIANYTDGFAYTAPVGSFPANKFGLHDMCGNVWQWVSDSYTGSNQRKDWGVLRGGSWGTSKQEEFRLGYRDVVDRSERDVIFGFRCVLAPER